jgi:hypothetical protein
MGLQNSNSATRSKACRVAPVNKLLWPSLFMPPDAPFSGSLPSKRLPVLEDIALALSISLPEKRLTKNDFLAAIKAHFDSKPNLRESPRFIGLFHRTCGQRRPNENTFPTEAPPTTRQRLEDHSTAQTQPFTDIPSLLPTPSSSNSHRTFYDRDVHDSRPPLHDNINDLRRHPVQYQHIH